MCVVHIGNQFIIMDRKWMVASRLSKEYEIGVGEFMRQAVQHFGNHVKMSCPCVRCGNIERARVKKIRNHLFEYGIDRTYTQWILHDELDNVGMDENDVDGAYEADRLEDMMDAAQDNFNGSVDEFENLLRRLRFSRGNTSITF